MIHATSLVLAEYRRKWPDPLIDPMDDSGVGPVAFARHHRRGSGVVVFMVGLLVERHPSLRAVFRIKPETW